MDNMLLDDYRKLVERVMHDVQASENCSSRVFTNSGTEHAAIVLNVMVENCQHSLDVFSHEMSADVWDSKALRRVFDRNPNAHMRVIVDNSQYMQSQKSCLSSLADLVDAKKIEVKIVRLPEGLTPSHIAISDGCHFRLETDAAERKAVVTFGKNETTKAVAGLFEKIWAVAH